MGNTISTRTRTEHDDENDDYVLVDSRNVILGLPGRGRSARRGGHCAPQFRRNPTRSAGPSIATGTRCTEPRRVAHADAAASISLWQQLARRVHHVGAGRVARRAT